MLNPEIRQDLFSRQNTRVGTQSYTENPPLYPSANRKPIAPNNIVEEKLFNDVSEQLNYQPNIVEENPELMPSQTTMEIVRQNIPQTQTQAPVAEGIKLNVQGKVLLATFGVIVLALVLAITLCAVAASSLSASVAVANGEIAAKLAQLSQLEGTIAGLEETARIESIANGVLGLQYPTQSQIVYYEALVANSNALTVPTNWFDAICNWLSSILG